MKFQEVDAAWPPLRPEVAAFLRASGFGVGRKTLVKGFCGLVDVACRIALRTRSRPPDSGLPFSSRKQAT